MIEEAVSAAEANRRFSRMLRNVRDGHSYVVTSHGRPVARLIPADSNTDSRPKARDVSLSRLRQQTIVHADDWTRDELYEDEG